MDTTAMNIKEAKNTVFCSLGGFVLIDLHLSFILKS